MLKSALEGAIKPKFIIIEDDIKVNGIPLLVQFVTGVVNRVSRTDIFSIDPSYEFIKAYVPSSTDRIVHHNFYAISGPHLKEKFDLFEYFQKNCVTSKNNGDRAIIIDSLSYVVVLSGLVETTRTIDKFEKFAEKEGISLQITCLLHSDVDEKANAQMEYLSPFILKLKPSHFNEEDEDTEVTIIHKKTNGTLSKKVEYYSITEGVFQYYDAKSSKTSSKDTADSEEQLLDAKLTFSLSLKEEEKESRANVVLPYEKTAQTSIAGDSSQINYEFEREDDYDEDDPDDDLNI